LRENEGGTRLTLKNSLPGEKEEISRRGKGGGEKPLRNRVPGVAKGA